MQSFGPARDYWGWDRFGRIQEQKWTTAAGVADDFGYAYDRNSNRLYERVLTPQGQGQVNPATFSELYHANSAAPGDNATAYDGLDRLKAFARGVLSASGNNGSVLDTVASSSTSQSWNLEGQGNWASTVIDSTTQTRTHNAANEIVDVSGSWIDPTCDAAGNMTSGPKAGAETTRLYYTYDGWNRLVQVRDAGYALIASYEYDAAGRRIEKVIPGGSGYTLDYFWNEDYQNIETRKNDSINPLEQWVFDIRYVDAPAVRFYDSNTDGTIDNTLYATFDANFNVTAIVNASGSVVERYVYTPYGTRTVLDADWTLDGDGLSDVAQDRGPQGLVIDPETGLVYNRARYLHTSLGRFTIRDLIEYGDGMNLYQYVHAAPTQNRDSEGLWSPDDHAMLTRRSINLVANAEFADLDVNRELLDALVKANENVDFQQFNDFAVHYTREIDATNKNVTAAEKAYQAAIGKAVSAFDFFIDNGKPTKEGCLEAMRALGRASHYWQDYFAHAVLRNGSPVCWNANPPVTGSPDNPNPQLKPASFATPNKGDHGKDEPADRDGAGGKAKRFDAAGKFVADKYTVMLPKFDKKCAQFFACAENAWNEVYA